jgi:putative acetyltransferase
VKLLLDENVSDRIVQRIVDLFPGSTHLKAVGLKEADDSVVWAWAKQRGFTIVSKDTDFYQRAIVFGHPPKFIWVRVGNCPTSSITALLRSRSEAVSLVAETDGRVIGHIAFSPVTISDGTPNWYGLGPVSVLPEHQRKGIGKALIKEGLSRLRDMNAQGCCLVGHPDYYKQFGFKNMSGLVLEGVPPEVFFALSFDRDAPQGAVTFHEGFNAHGHQEGVGGSLRHA